MCQLELLLFGEPSECSDGSYDDDSLLILAKTTFSNKSIALVCKDIISS